MKCTCPTQRPNARDPTQPILLEMAFAFATQCEEIYTKKMKCTLPTRKISVTQRQRYQHVGIFCVG